MFLRMLHNVWTSSHVSWNLMEYLNILILYDRSGWNTNPAIHGINPAASVDMCCNWLPFHPKICPELPRQGCKSSTSCRILQTKTLWPDYSATFAHLHVPIICICEDQPEFFPPLTSSRMIIYVCHGQNIGKLPISWDRHQSIRWWSKKKKYSH